MARFLLIEGERQGKVREISFSAEFTRIHTYTHTHTQPWENITHVTYRNHRVALRTRIKTGRSKWSSRVFGVCYHKSYHHQDQLHLTQNLFLGAYQGLNLYFFSRCGLPVVYDMHLGMSQLLSPQFKGTCFLTGINATWVPHANTLCWYFKLSRGFFFYMEGFPSFFFS